MNKRKDRLSRLQLESCLHCFFPLSFEDSFISMRESPLALDEQKKDNKSIMNYALFHWPIYGISSFKAIDILIVVEISLFVPDSVTTITMNIYDFFVEFLIQIYIG